MLLAGLILWLSQPAFLYTQDHLPRGGTTHSGLGPPIPIINQENASWVYPQQVFRWGSCSQVTLAGDKLTRRLSRTHAFLINLLKPILSHTAKEVLSPSSASPYLTYSKHLFDSLKNYLLDINDKIIKYRSIFHEMYLIFEKKSSKRQISIF